MKKESEFLLYIL